MAQPALLLPPLPSQEEVRRLSELCLDRVGAEPSACLGSVSRGGWHLLSPSLRL